MAMFVPVGSRLHRLRSRVRAVRRAASEARQQTEQALQALGVNTGRPAAQVIDVDPRRQSMFQVIAARTLQGLAVAASMVLLGIALWSLGMFLGASLLAFVVVTRALGLHIDLGTARASSAPA
jgi:hypothetical protein